MSELKPCPFCGEKIKEVPGFNGVCGCESDNCPGSLVEYMTLDEWNTRPIEDALQAEIERLEAERRWIPVSERLPERDGFYFILENVNQVAGYYHWCKQFGWNTDGGRIHIQTITHWMPLPTPPEEK